MLLKEEFMQQTDLLFIVFFLYFCGCLCIAFCFIYIWCCFLHFFKGCFVSRTLILTCWQLTIRCKDIVKVTKEKTARVIPNAIQICTKDDKYFFTSFGTRDKTFLMLERVWKNGVSDQVCCPPILCCVIHCSHTLFKTLFYEAEVSAVFAAWWSSLTAGIVYCDNFKCVWL